MPISNFPNGFSNGVNIRGLPRLDAYAGSVFWVDSGAGSDSYRGTFDQPFATIDYAVGQCTANNGDIICVKPGHTEAVITDGAIACDVAGITIWGIGTGSDRPTITVSTAAAATVTVTAANVTLHNLLFLGNLAALVSCLEIAGDSCEVSHCEFRESTLGMITAITIGVADGDADHCYIHDCLFYMDEPGVTNLGDAAIELIFDSDHIRIENNFIYGDFDDAGINVAAGGNASDFLTISGNYIENTAAGAYAIQINTAGTMNGGSITDNILVADAPATTLEPHTLHVSGNQPEEKLTGSGAEVFFVDSGSGSDAGDGTALSPFATLDYAIGQCTASTGSTIYLMAGHAETISAAAAIAFDVAGVRVVGLGEGRNRPTITLDTLTTTDIDIDQANVTIENIVIDVTGVDAIVNGLDVNAADFTLKNCEVILADAGGQAAGFLTTASDRTRVIDCYLHGSSDAGAEDAIEITGTPDGIEIIGNRIIGDFSNAGIQSASAFTNATVRDNYVENLNAGNHAIQFSAAATGVLQANTLVSDALATALDPGSMACVDNKWHDSTFTNIQPITIPVGAAGASLVPLQKFVTRTVVSTSMATGFGTGDSPVTIFTVTGDVLVYAAWATATTAVSSTSDTGTWELGVTGNTAVLQAQTTLGAGAFAQHDTWSNGGFTPGQLLENSDVPVAISGEGTDIILTIATNNTAGGTAEFYCIWSPLSNDANIVGLTI